MKIKKIIAVLLTCAVVGMGIPTQNVIPMSFNVSAAEDEYIAENEGVLTYWVYSDHAEVTLCNKYAESVKILSKIKGVPVTSIRDNAFDLCTYLTSITIPDSVTSIGYAPFLYCNSLKKVKVSENNPEYSDIDGILFNKSKTELIVYPYSKEDSMYVIPNSVTSIESSAFAYCSNLEEIIIPDSVKNIGKYAFLSCASLTEITIPASVTSIGDYAFGYWLDVYDRVDKIKNFTIYGYSDTAAETYANKNGFTFIPLSVIYKAYSDHAEVVGCDKSAESAEIFGKIGNLPVTSIGDMAFYDCESLTSITIPDSVKSIGEYAFFDCNSLTEITIPDSVTSIGYSAFNSCDSLTEIKVSEENPEYCDMNGILFDKSKTELIVYPCKKTYEKYYIPYGVTSIGDHAFRDCTSLTSIIIPYGVTNIGDMAFYDCKGLTSITIPSSVTRIEIYAFHGCTSLTSITIPDSVTSIDDSAFKNCTSLTEITISDGVTNIGNSVFKGCTGLTEITIPDSVTSIGYEAFGGCENLTSITILNPECKIADLYSINSNVVIKGYSGSTAESYAKKYDITFESLGEPPVSITTPGNDNLPGDANCDGEVNLADAVLIMQNMANPAKYTISDQGKLNGDVSGNGDGITNKDALAIQKLTLGILTSLPET